MAERISDPRQKAQISGILVALAETAKNNAVKKALLTSAYLQINQLTPLCQTSAEFLEGLYYRINNELDQANTPYH